MRGVENRYHDEDGVTYTIDQELRYYPQQPIEHAQRSAHTKKDHDMGKPTINWANTPEDVKIYEQELETKIKKILFVNSHNSLQTLDSDKQPTTDQLPTNTTLENELETIPQMEHSTA